ncbi:PIN domain-containing protein [Paracoccus subflavus]|uniref:PIN domain-containing protein n=1 Tax=Paracoccus subflavus TaxID=2528244 RepID=A0A4Q9G322_9RHOB|nr:PIN domain-containing protein [Paracoccus subflavus]TBN41077.1 PIN domain-containing protein [Paracoccus subflavus]
MANPQRIYWDACAWIAYIAKETTIPLKGGGQENRFVMCEAVLKGAREGKYEIVTSCFTLAEVCKNGEVKSSPVDNLPAFFEHSYILTVPVDLALGRHAQNIQASGLVALKPPDAVHLASALRARVDQIHTFDANILKLDGTIPGRDGKPLKIVKPGADTSPMPLFGKGNDEE